jgi:nickel-dependent lactate racemase
MGMKEFSLPYGKGSVSFEIPEEQVLYEIWGRDYPVVKNLEETYKTALEHPIDAPPLSQLVKPENKIVILAADITRTWQRNADTLPILIETLNQLGVPDDNITIIIAVGAHRPNTEEEFAEICGDDVCHRIRMVNHDASDKANMVYLGRTSRGTEVSVNRLAVETDRLIMTGGVIYHFLAGYGGGRKMILPGISSIDTIRQNHLRWLGPNLGDGSRPECGSAVTRGNPVHEDMMDICSFVNPNFTINMVPNLDGEIAGIIAGNWVSAWLEATKLVDHIFDCEIEEQADIVIGSAGGYPRDINLYQTSKLMDNCYQACKDTGVSLLLSECPDINEPSEFYNWFNHPSLVEMERALRDNMTIGGLVAFKVQEYCRKKTILLTRPENAAHVAKTHLIPAYSIEEAMKLAYENCGTPNPKVTLMPQGASVLPRLKK